MSTRNILLPATAVLLGLSACAATPAPAGPAPAGPAASTATSAVPSEVPVPAATVTAEPTRPAKPAEVPGRTPDCPSAKTLEGLTDLPADWQFVPSSVQCWKTWSWADAEGPTPGDGIHLFRWTKATGWKFHSEGSGYHCKDIGINEKAPFCGYP